MPGICCSMDGNTTLKYLTSEVNAILGEAAINASVRYAKTYQGVRQLTLSEVLTLVPTKDRCFGKVIYFLNQDVNPLVEVWMFIGTELSAWENSDQWKLVLTSNNIKDSAKDPYKSLENVTNYLYELEYSLLDYNYAKSYFNSRRVVFNPGACSSLKKGGLIGRYLDWHYSYLSDAIIHTSRMANRYASVGVAGGLTGLTQDFIESQEPSALYKLLPFYLQDGVNEKGLYCSMNVVPKDNGITYGTSPTIEMRDTVCNIMLVRYILDHFATAEEAIDYISNYVSVFTPKSLSDMGYDVHFMLADDPDEQAYVLEFVNNSISISRSDIMTNFFLHGVNFKSNGDVYTQADISQGYFPSVHGGITLYGSGLERFNKLNSLKASVTDIASMASAMESVLYTNTYKAATTPFWFSEYVSPKVGISLNTLVTDPVLVDLISTKAYDFEHRTRGDGKTWQTTHGCVYDLVNKQIKVFVQEDTENVFTFGLKKN